MHSIPFRKPKCPELARTATHWKKIRFQAQKGAEKPLPPPREEVPDFNFATSILRVEVQLPIDISSISSHRFPGNYGMLRRD
jgi:hypothetical protein